MISPSQTTTSASSSHCAISSIRTPLRLAALLSCWLLDARQSTIQLPDVLLTIRAVMNPCMAVGTRAPTRLARSGPSSTEQHVQCGSPYAFPSVVSNDNRTRRYCCSVRHLSRRFSRSTSWTTLDATIAAARKIGRRGPFGCDRFNAACEWDKRANSAANVRGKNLGGLQLPPDST